MHKFSVGQVVGLASNKALRASPGNYTIVRLIPDESNSPKYRIKSKNELYERVADETDLKLVGGSEKAFR